MGRPSSAKTPGKLSDDASDQASREGRRTPTSEKTPWEERRAPASNETLKEERPDLALGETFRESRRAPASGLSAATSGAPSFLDAAAPGRALARRLDPRGKILAAFGFSLVLALGRDRHVALAGLGLGLLATALARVPLAILLRRTAAVNVFTLMLWLGLPWRLVPGPGWSAPGLVFDPTGLDLALVLTLKVNAVFLVLLGLMGTSGVTDLLHALAHFRLPSKLVVLFFLFHRYLFVIHEQYLSLRQAMAIRCFRPSAGPRTYRAYAHLVGMLLVRSLERADRVHQAMLCRGFAGSFWMLDHFAWKAYDTAFLTLWGLGLAALAWLEWGRSL